MANKKLKTKVRSITTLEVKNLSEWSRLFEIAKKKHKPESDMFQGLLNIFDEREWNAVLQRR